MNRLRFRTWQRFLALFLASVMIFTQAIPTFAGLPATQPSAPAPAPAPANQNVAPPFAANDNIRPYTGKVPRKVSAGVAIRGITPWLVEAAEGVALFGISAGETILFFQWMGKTNVTWGDIYDTLKSGDYQPFASPSQAKQPAPAVEYPCADSTANYPGKLEADSPKTAGEIELFNTLRKITGGLIQDNFLYRFGSEVVDAKRLSALYGVKGELWAEHRIYGNLKDSKGRRVFLRFFRNQYTVIDYEYKLLAECEEKNDCEKFRQGRADYEAQVRNLANEAKRLENSGKSIEEVAREVSGMRREIGKRFKELTEQEFPDIMRDIIERNQGEYNKDPLGPTYEELIAKDKSNQQIIESAARPNSDGFVKKLEAKVCKD